MSEAQFRIGARRSALSAGMVSAAEVTERPPHYVSPEPFDPYVVEVMTPASPAACGYTFPAWQVVVIAASLRQQQYETDSCAMAVMNPPKR